jgi:uncharacterized membrane protein
VLRIENAYPRDIWVAIWYYSPNCPDGGDWAKKGWWRISPGQGKVVFGGSLKDHNRYFCYLAESDDGAYWAGPYVTAVPPQPFDWCLGTANSQSRDAGFRLLDIQSYDNFTLTLHA